MMRRAPIPHAVCGSAPVCSRRNGGLRTVRALALLSTAGLSLSLLVALPVDRAGPEHLCRRRAPQQASFPKQKGGMFGPRPRSTAPSRSTCRPTSCSTTPSNNRVIAQGNVEIYYNNYILTADQVIYDQGINKLIAEGNAQLKDPNGSITRADRFEALDDFRDAFVQSLSVVTAGRHAHRRRAGDAAARATSPSTSAASSRPARTTRACRRCGASAPRASSTTSRRPPSPTRMRSSSCSACRSCTCPTSSTPTRR